MKKILLPALLFLNIGLKAQMKASDVQSFTLKNGMKFLVVEDNSIPNGISIGENVKSSCSICMVMESKIKVAGYFFY